MINSNELRIGNKVISLGIDYDAGENKIHDPEGDEVVTVDVDVIKDSIIQPNHYTGIPLTPEWLERCGFTVQTFEGEDGALVSMKGFFSCEPFYQEDHSLSINTAAPLARRLKYVHELQNYFFAATGKDLTIKETV